MSALVAFIHHLAAFTLVAALVLEKVSLRDVAAGIGGGTVDAANARKLMRTDMIFGMSAGILLAAGLLRVFVFEKGTGYYFHSVPFIVKASLFVIVGLVSIIPTVEFIKWGKALKSGRPVQADSQKIASLQKIVQLEIAGVVVIVLCAALMAKGIGVVG